MKNEVNEKQNIAIAELKTEVKNLKENLNKFMSNDFHELKDDVKKIDDKILYGFLAMIAATLILQIILKFLK